MMLPGALDRHPNNRLSRSSRAVTEAEYLEGHAAVRELDDPRFRLGSPTSSAASEGEKSHRGRAYGEPGRAEEAHGSPKKHIGASRDPSRCRGSGAAAGAWSALEFVSTAHTAGGASASLDECVAGAGMGSTGGEGEEEGWGEGGEDSGDETWEDWKEDAGEALPAEDLRDEGAAERSDSPGSRDTTGALAERCGSGCESDGGGEGRGDRNGDRGAECGLRSARVEGQPAAPLSGHGIARAVDRGARQQGGTRSPRQSDSVGSLQPGHLPRGSPSPASTRSSLPVVGSPSHRSLRVASSSSASGRLRGASTGMLCSQGERAGRGDGTAASWRKRSGGSSDEQAQVRKGKKRLLRDACVL